MSATSLSSRAVLGLLAGAALVALAAAGVAGSRTAPAPEPVAAALEFAESDLAPARTRELSRTLPLTGSLRPLAEALVKAKVAGELQALSVREGERVRRGQELGRIDPVEARARQAQQQAELEAARAQLQMAEKNRASQQALLERKFISRNAYDNTESNHDVAAAKVRAAEAALAVASKALQDTRLVAPMDGIVAQRFAQPGERVPVDGKVLALADLTRLEVMASVPVSEIGQVRVGQPVAFRIEGHEGRSFAGQVERINPVAAAGSRSIDLYLVIDNADGALRGGLFAQGELTLERLPAAVVVPLSAVREESGRSVVYVIEDGRVSRRPVTLGRALRDEGLVQVSEGLSAGSRVVRHNLGVLADGAPARIVAAAR